MSKTTEHAVETRLAAHLSRTNPLNSTMHAYCINHFTETALLSIHDHLINAINSQQTSLVLLVFLLPFDCTVLACFALCCVSIFYVCILYFASDRVLIKEFYYYYYYTTTTTTTTTTCIDMQDMLLTDLRYLLGLVSMVLLLAGFVTIFRI